MNNLNSILIEGNLVRDPEFKTTAKGIALCNFSIATNRWYKQGEGFEKEVSFFDIETWAKLAENVNSKATKGRGVRIVGRLKQDRWNADDGKTHSRVVIVAEHVEFRPEAKKAEADSPLQGRSGREKMLPEVPKLPATPEADNVLPLLVRYSHK